MGKDESWILHQENAIIHNTEAIYSEQVHFSAQTTPVFARSRSIQLQSVSKSELIPNCYTSYFLIGDG